MQSHIEEVCNAECSIKRIDSGVGSSQILISFLEYTEELDSCRLVQMLYSYFNLTEISSLETIVVNYAIM
jgi:hypothetical protein